MGSRAGLVWLQAAEGPAADPFGFLFPMVLIFLIFYFLLIRPQQRRQKNHEKMLASVAKGDKVVSSGGVHGIVTGVTDEILTVEIANVKGERVRIKLDRSKVDRRERSSGGEEG